jgi:hypothetical protein
VSPLITENDQPKECEEGYHSNAKTTAVKMSNALRGNTTDLQIFRNPAQTTVGMRGQEVGVKVRLSSAPSVLELVSEALQEAASSPSHARLSGVMTLPHWQGRSTNAK